MNDTFFWHHLHLSQEGPYHLYSLYLHLMMLMATSPFKNISPFLHSLSLTHTYIHVSVACNIYYLYISLHSSGPVWHDELSKAKRSGEKEGCEGQDRAGYGG
jgi:hypothetical protein